MNGFGTIRVGLLFWLLGLPAFSLPAYAQTEAAEKRDGPSLEEIMEKMDVTINGFEDQEMMLTMTIIDVDGSRKSYGFRITQIGGEKRLVRFTTGEIKGLAILSENRNRSYVYLPGFKRVRRISASNLNQNMAGSDFTYDDMSSTVWSKLCITTLEREEEDAWYLRCSPKPEEKVGYKYLIMKVLKDGFFQAAVEYYNSKDKLYKKMICKDMVVWPDGHKRFKTIIMENMLTGHKTVFDIHEFKANQGLKESQFTVRQLTWGR